MRVDEEELQDFQELMPDTLARDLDIKRALERFSSQLSDEDWTIFTERVYNDTPYIELAQNLAVTVYALKMHMLRLKLKLKKELDYDVEL